MIHRMEIVYPIPDELCEKVLETFPGIWFVTAQDGSVVAASKNYHERLRHDLMFQADTPLPDGLIMHWLVPLNLLPPEAWPEECLNLRSPPHKL